MSRPPTDTEERLFNEALTLFAFKGYSATSVREIIETVGLTKPVLYYYCESKLDLFEKLIHRIHRKALKGLEDLVEGPEASLEKLRLMIHGTFAFCRNDWRIPRLMYGAAYGPRVEEIDAIIESFSDQRYGLIRQVIEEGVSTGELRSGDADALALSFCSLMDHPVNAMTRAPSDVEKLTPELAECLFGVFATGAQRKN